MRGTTLLASLTALATSILVSSAFAQQQSTTKAPAASGTTATTAEQVKPEAAKKWGASLTLWGFMDASDLNDNGSQASLKSANVAGVSYKATKDESYGIAAQFEMNMIPNLDNRSKSIEDEMRPGGAPLSRNGLKALDPYISYKKTLRNLNMMGLKDVDTLYRFYPAIVGDNYLGSNLNNQRRGALRLSAEPSWQINPIWSFAYTIDPRFYFRENETTLRFIQGPKVGYSVNEKAALYLTALFDTIAGKGNVGGSLWTGELSRNNAQIEYGIELMAMKNLVLIAAYGTEFSLNETAKPFILDNSSYSLLMSISI